MNTERLKASDLAGRRAALVVGHPGHELRLHGWLEIARPDVFVLTEGSGCTGSPRLDSTVRVLDRTGGRPAGIFGVFTDKQVYSTLLSRRFDPFIRLVDDLATRLRELNVDYVVGDAYEGFSPTHDLCRILTGAAVERLRRQGISVGNYDFLLEGHPGQCDVPQEQGSLRLDLSNDAFDRKITAARAYTELAHEVELADRLYGLEAFRVEWLRPVPANFGLQQPNNWIPKYESYGDDRVANGRYTQVLRYREHFRPLAQAMWEYATAPSQRAASRRSFQAAVSPRSRLRASAALLALALRPRIRTANR